MPSILIVLRSSISIPMQFSRLSGQRIFPVGEADVLRIKSTFAPWNLLNYFVPSFRMC